MNHSLGRFTSNCGQIFIEGYKACKIIHNGNIMSYNGPDGKSMPNLKFGLITYECDNMFGYLISKLDCIGCNFRCVDDEYENGCQHEYAQAWLSIICATVLSIFVGCILFVVLWKIQNSICFGAQQRRSRSTPESENEVSPSITEVAKSSTLQKTYSVNRMIKPELKQSRKDDDIDVVDDDFEKVDWTKRKIQELHRPTPSPLPTPKTKWMSLFLSPLLIKMVSSCDITLYMRSNNLDMICNVVNCSSVPPYSFTVGMGAIICIDDHINIPLSLVVSEIGVTSRYRLDHYTADYVALLMEEQNQTCSFYKTNSEFCFREDNEYCSPKRLAQLSNSTQISSSILSQGWSCETVTSGFYFSVKGYLCCQYRWIVEKEGKLYPVYTRVRENPYVKFTVLQDKDKIRRELILSKRDPTLNATGGLKIYFLTTRMETTRTALTRLISDDKLYFANESTSATMGYFQVSLKEDHPQFMPPKNGSCREKNPSVKRNCECECTSFPQNTISSLIQEYRNSNHRHANDFLIVGPDSTTIDTFELLKTGSVNLKIGDLSGQETTPEYGKCDVELSVTFSCSLCNHSSYLVLIPRHVEKEGIIPFHSNCSFDKPYIVCDEFEPMKLTLIGNHRTCSIKGPSIKSALIVNFSYLNLNGLLKSNQNLSDTGQFRRKVDCVVGYEAFIHTFLKATLLWAILGVSVLIMRRLCYKNKPESNLVSVQFQREGTGTDASHAQLILLD